jgi:hypothetical protein
MPMNATHTKASRAQHLCMHVYLYQYKTQTIQALEFFLKHALNLFDERKLTASTDLQPRYLELSSPCYVLGDIHGNLTDLEFFHQRVWPNGPQVGRAPACNGLMPSSWFASVTANVLVRAASSGMISYAMMWRRGSEYACELEMAQQMAHKMPRTHAGWEKHKAAFGSVGVVV